MTRTFRSIGLAAGASMFLAVATAAFAQGANTSGPYDPQNVGLPSLNGNGNGNAYGKPAAGTVGNADKKNPPGQLKGDPIPFMDPNNGYECDENNGIAKGNPAHSTCGILG